MAYRVEKVQLFEPINTSIYHEMKIFHCFLLISIAFSCQKQESETTFQKTQPHDQETQVDQSSKEVSINVLAECKKSISSYLKNEWLTDSSVYEPVSWGDLDTINALDFKYKFSHQYKSPGKIGARDTILLVNHTFTLTANFQISSVVETTAYDRYYDSDGLPYNMFGSRELQRIGIANGYDMVLYEREGNLLLIVGGDTRPSRSIGISKKAWISRNITGAREDLLQETDTVEYCTDLIGDECYQYVFRAGKLAEVNEVR